MTLFRVEEVNAALLFVQRLKNPALLPVDIEAFIGSLKELIVPPQKVAFSVKK